LGPPIDHDTPLPGAVSVGVQARWTRAPRRLCYGSVTREEPSQMNSTTLQQWAPTAHALLRIVTGLIFLEHGLQKFFGFPPGQMANIPFDNMGAYAGVIELACGFLVTIGLFT